MTAADVTAAVRRCLRLWGGDPLYINDGFCGEFSYMVVEHLGGETEDLYESFTEKLSPGHCWVTFQDRHYDAEAPEGVDTAQELPFFRRATNASGPDP